MGAGGQESSGPLVPVQPTLPQPLPGSGLGGVRDRVASRRRASPPVPGAAATPPSAMGQPTPVVPAPPPAQGPVVPAPPTAQGPVVPAPPTAQGPVVPDPAAANTVSAEGSATSRLLERQAPQAGLAPGCSGWGSSARAAWRAPAAQIWRRHPARSWWRSPHATLRPARHWRWPTAAPTRAVPPSLIARPDIDAVLVCTHNASHGTLVRAALSVGKHVLVEYPLALSTAEADAAVAMAQNRRLALRVGYDQQFLGPHAAIHAMVGKLGMPLAATIQVMASAPAGSAFRGPDDRRHAGAGQAVLPLCDPRLAWSPGLQHQPHPGAG